MDDWWTGKWFRRRRPWSNLGSIPELAWTAWGKPRKTWVRMGGVPAEMLTHYSLPNVTVLTILRNLHKSPMSPLFNASNYRCVYRSVDTTINFRSINNWLEYICQYNQYNQLSPCLILFKSTYLHEIFVLKHLELMFLPQSKKQHFARMDTGRIAVL
jgi:hypothetical protein